MILTLKELDEAKACYPGMELFEELFGESLDIGDWTLAHQLMMWADADMREYWVWLVQEGFVPIWPAIGASFDGLDLSCLEAPGVDLRFSSFEGASLAKSVLSQADLSGAKLVRASLRGAELAQASLSRASLQHADCRGVYMSGASLRYADCRYVDFTDANLFRADFCGADLRGIDLTDVNLMGAYLGGAKMDSRTRELARQQGATVD